MTRHREITTTSNQLNNPPNPATNATNNLTQPATPTTTTKPTDPATTNASATSPINRDTKWHRPMRDLSRTSGRDTSPRAGGVLPC